MFALAFFIVAAGLFLADSAIKGRDPLQTLRDIVASPRDTRSILAGSRNPFVVGSGTYDLVSGEDTSGLGSINDPLITAIIAYARAQIGKPYQWGAEGPNAYDCSGLVWAAYNSAGVPIPRTTVGQLAAGTRVARKNLRPGDLVFPYPGHVFLYIGGGKTIEATRPGENVQYGTVYKFWTARRYV